ncbi:MAG: T9SS type A sorting domain-containing protein [Candidatus Cloacimonetes bacterium]|nr:T9SS type A sorting domain-containing protein [Candidatus Cloacimonadota bacterium]
MKKTLVLIALSLFTLFSFAEIVNINDNAKQVNVLSSNDNQTVIEYNFGEFSREIVNIDGENYYNVFLDSEAPLMEKGNPALPKFSRSIIIPNNAGMEIQIVEKEYVEYDMRIAPSKGRILRNIDPQTVPYDFSDVYENNDFFPQKNAYLGEPYILRDYRGVTVNVVPFAYNPQTKILRVYHYIVIEINNVGNGSVNVKNTYTQTHNKHFQAVYENHFINYLDAKYELVDEHGRMIVISYGSFMDAIQPFVDWKIQKGFQVDVYNISDIGNANNIESFIQSQYDLNDGLAFVQLVGDNAQVPSLMNGGYGADPRFALVDGNDPYMDIFVGRFSAENVAQVETQVLRSVWYERDIIDGDWLAKGMGVASNQGTGDDNEYDNAHQDVIRGKLLDFGYTEVDQIYDPSANSTQVANALNNGRGIVNYTGHGSTSAWNSSGFGVGHINNLTNDYKLPFVNTVACLNGNFTGGTCFAEAWMRATHNGNPTGAIAIFASSINQSWDPPMAAQDESVDMITGSLNYAGNPGVMTTLGGLWFNGEGEMLDLYPNSTAESETWHIFGDASLQVRTKVPETMTISHSGTLIIGQTTFDVSAGVENAMVCLSADGVQYGAGFTNDSGMVTITMETPPASPMDLTLTVSAYNKITSVETIGVISPEGPYLIISDVQIDAGGDDIIEFGETVTLDITIENVGVEDATNSVLQFTEDDSYITLTDSNETFGDIAAGESVTLNNVISFTVDSNIPNEHLFELISDITCTGYDFDGSENFTAYAPILLISNIEISDDDNNMLDPGDRADILVTLSNNGGAKAQNLTGILSSLNNLVTFNENTDTSTMIEAGETIIFIFDINVSEDAETCALAEFLLNTTADNGYSENEAFELTIGIVMETFETGDFSSFEWEFSGNADWQIVTEAHEGSYAAKSGTISHNSTSEILLEMPVSQADEIKFWKKVSSENNYDYLKFYIDNQQIAEWCGDEDWSLETFDVSAGTHTFKWVYYKDGSVNSGSDCAWIDDITFPGVGSIPASLESDPTEFVLTMPQNTVEDTTLTLENVGENGLDYSITNQFNWLAFSSTEGSLDVNESEEITLTFDTTDLEAGVISEDIIIMYNGRSVLIIPIELTIESVDANDDMIPLVTSVGTNYPNPFNPETTIKYQLSESGMVQMEIYNVKGQKVKTLVNIALDKGYYDVVWAGDDDNNRKVSSGIYFYTFRTSRFTTTKKMILMK